MKSDLPAGASVIEQSLTLLDLSRRLRGAASVRELGFMLVNDTRSLVAYRQAALWLAGEGAYALSGVVQVEGNAPYAQWLDAVCRHLAAQAPGQVRALVAMDLPAPLAADWQAWWPAHAAWLPLPAGPQAGPEGIAAGAGLLLARELPWGAEELLLLQEWADVSRHALHALHRPRLTSWRGLRERLRGGTAAGAGRSWWRRPGPALALVLLGVALFPVRLTVLAPGELVPANPVVVRAPIDGVVDAFHVQPNDSVAQHQPLFGFDEALIQSRAEVAAQALAAAQTEYRQTSQQALTDPRSKQLLALLVGKIEEKRAELDYLRDQLQRARVLAPQAGVVLFDDPSEWIGRPVAVGERILRIALPSDSEVEAWLPIADAIALEPGAPLTLHLNASPLAPVSARLRFQAHEAVQRPDGSYAYRVRASLDEPTAHRVGLKGTAKLHGNNVPLGYWVLRRPLAAVRATLGL